MHFIEAIEPFSQHSLWFILTGLAILAVFVLPKYLEKHPFSLPIALLIIGFLAVKLPFGMKSINPMDNGKLTEYVTELGVIISLMGAGLKIDRPIGWKAWGSTWRLLGITMVLSIVLSALVGWWVMAFAPVTALLLGAVIAPTDPVLAAEVQVGAPSKGKKNGKDEEEVRFALTSEAGFNDALAFPFTNLALALGIIGISEAPWWQSWLLVDVFYKLIVGGLVGWALGKLLAKLLLGIPTLGRKAKMMLGLGTLAATLLLYGATEMLGGYGFLAVFIGAITIRGHKRDHEHHEYLHHFAEKAENIFMAGILLVLGGAIADGLLQPLTWQLIAGAIVIVLVVRPLSGAIGMIGYDRVPWRDRLAISFFGIRGIGSLYYLAYALNRHYFPNAETLWALVALIVVVSILLHGITAAPVMNWLDRQRGQ